jgi:hypothetical protein
MPVKDVKIYTGAAEGWVSIGDLSKANLPISSTDNKVTLSDDDGTFIVKTGDTAGGQTNQLVVADDGVVGVNIDDPNLAGGGEGIHIHSDVAGVHSELHMTTVNTGSSAGDGLNIQMGSDKNVKINNRSDGSIQMFANNDESLRVSEEAVTAYVNQVIQVNNQETSAPSSANNVNNKQMVTLKSTDEAGAKFIGLSFQHVLSGSKGASACIGLQDESADGVPNKGEMQFVIRGDNSAQVATPLKINKDAIIVDGQIQTNTITDKDGVGASIGLGSSVNSVFIDSTSGFTGSGIRFEVNQKSAGSTVTNFDGFATIANTLADSKIATMSGSRTSMRNTGAGAEVNQVFGYYVYEMPAAATLTGDNPIAAGLRLTNNNSGDGDYNILADGTAPSKFWGPIEYSSTDLITKDEHLVTKGWVTSNAGGGGTLPVQTANGNVVIDGTNGGTLEIETTAGCVWNNNGKQTFKQLAAGGTFAMGDNAGSTAVQLQVGTSADQPTATGSYTGLYYKGTPPISCDFDNTHYGIMSGMWYVRRGIPMDWVIAYTARRPYYDEDNYRPTNSTQVTTNKYAAYYLDSVSWSRAKTNYGVRVDVSNMTVPAVGNPDDPAPPVDIEIAVITTTPQEDLPELLYGEAADGQPKTIKNYNAWYKTDGHLYYLSDYDKDVDGSGTWNPVYIPSYAYENYGIYSGGNADNYFGGRILADQQTTARAAENDIRTWHRGTDSPSNYKRYQS